ncbi:hypothetical protein JQC92_02365 [Shewanella sp. 202IG2-18]|uniref:hypothetical protein n=1 Tax=Parashewanella hymeniacidonis TaxID=2807618 RepID=UPI00195F4584|nr:hypothetical protein [Parashewanella hymeniacidonis]MBM7070885.1 hypothetical protein [Parashewanella hymeniacidonis]
MASNWAELQTRFLIEHEKTGISAKDWCALNGLNYQTARRYIKNTKASDDQKAKASSSVSVKKSQRANDKKNKNGSGEKMIKRPSMVGNQNGRKHGGYSKYFKDPSIEELVEATTLEDELSLCRSRIHDVIEVIKKLQEQATQSTKPEITASIADSLMKAEIVLEKNIARVESINRTISSIAVDKERREHIIADRERVANTARLANVNSTKSIMQTELLELQIAKERKEQGGTSKLDNFIDELTNADGDVDLVVAE